MSDIAKGVGNLFTSIAEIIKGIITTIIHVFQAAFNAVFQAFQGLFNAIIGLFKGAFNLTEGVLGFIIGNFFLLGTLAAVYFGYILYQQRQGKNPAPISAAVTKKQR